MHRRHVLAAAAGSLFGSARAEDFPSRAIKVVVPTAAGGGSDIMARHLAERLRIGLGTSVVVENRPGAGGNIGVEYVRNAPADGYTLLITATAFAIAPAVNRKLSFDPVRDFTPLTLIANVPIFVATAAGSPYRSLADVISAARSKSDLSFASFGLGSTAHLVGEVINQAAGIKMVHVPYRGASQAVPDLLAGRTTIGILDTVSAGPLVRSGDLRALAITGLKRSRGFPETPTLAEVGVPFDTVGWHALFGPAPMPDAVASRLNGAVNEILARPDMREIIETGGSVPIEPPTSLAAWRSGFEADVTAWGKVARDAGVMIE